MKKATENSNLPLKLSLRQKLLDISGFEEYKVIDCCTAKGMIWNNLKKKYKVTSYLPFDTNPQLPGTIRMDSIKALNQIDIAKYNVIDIDTFGEPWKHYEIALNKLKSDTIIYLTIGINKVCGGSISNKAKEMMGIPLDWHIPMNDKLAKKHISFLLTMGCENCKITNVYKAELPNVTYYGILYRKRD